VASWPCCYSLDYYSFLREPFWVILALINNPLDSRYATNHVGLLDFNGIQTTDSQNLINDFYVIRKVFHITIIDKSLFYAGLTVIRMQQKNKKGSYQAALFAHILCVIR